MSVSGCLAYHAIISRCVTTNELKHELTCSFKLALVRHVLVALEFVGGAALAADVPADDGAVSRAREEHLPDRIPRERPDRVRVAFERRDRLVPGVLQFQHRDLATLISDEGCAGNETAEMR